MASKIKATMANTFHNSTATVQGTPTTLDGNPAVRISGDSYRRACRKLCGIKGCLCGNHQNYATPYSGDPDGDMVVLIGK